MATVVVLGSVNLDQVVRVARMPLPGETISGRSFVTVPGGKGLNQAVAAHRAGASTLLLGAIGDDSAGRELTEFLTSEGLAEGVQTLPGGSGTAHITVDDAGENSIIVVPGANGAVLPLDEARRNAIAAARLLVMQLEVPQSMLAEAAGYARSQGVTTVLTPAPVQEVDPELLAGIDVLVPNEHEARQLAGVDDVEQAAVLLSAGRTVLVTLGAAGVLAARDGAVIARMPGRQVEAVDTTGAGDTFVGALTAQLAAGAALEDAMQWATVAASISVTRPGATSSMPTRAEVQAALSAG